MACMESVTLTSRVRLARNVADTPFPGRMARQDMERICALAGGVFSGADFDIVPVGDLSPAKKYAFIERHLASPALMDNGSGMLILSRDETIAIMVGEEDHLRIQSIVPGNELSRALGTAQEVNRMLENSISFAYDEGLGYLTTCPTNVGTGLRASVMMHLPALTMTGKMGNVQKALQNHGMAVRGIYGEGSTAMGNIYQISNRITLGATEEQLTKGVEATVMDIVKQENDTCDIFKSNPPASLEDGVFRSYGLMANARKMELPEFMRLWSSVMLGRNMGWIDLDDGIMCGLLNGAQNGQLALQHGNDSTEVAKARADMCRNAMAHASITR